MNKSTYEPLWQVLNVILKELTIKPLLMFF